MATAAIPVPSSHWEWQYLDLMRRIWEHGDERVDRTGVGTRSIF
jgi:thymidylate synthase